LRNTSFSCLALAAMAALLFGSNCYAQTPPAQSPTEVQASTPNTPTTPAGALSGVRYDYRWEIYGGVAYSHFNAGPNLLQGANLGGFDVQAARFLRPRWAIAANVRGYYGTSGVAPNPYGIQGPFVSEHMFLAGPEWRGPSNEHASLTLHALVGGAYGDFQRDIGTVPPAALGLFSNKFTFGSAFGGSLDLNRSPRLVFRISPDATLTTFGSGGLQDQFAISVGLVYRLGKGLK
jgi:hypothetical protein